MDLIMRRWKARVVKKPCGRDQVVELVFHVEGRPVGDWRKTWKKPCETAKVPG